MVRRGALPALAGALALLSGALAQPSDLRPGATVGTPKAAELPPDLRSDDHHESTIQALQEFAAAKIAQDAASNGNPNSANSNGAGNGKGNAALPTLQNLSTAYDSDQSAAGFLFDVRAKQPVVMYGLDVNMVPAATVRDGPETRVKVYTKAGTHKGSEKDESKWELWIDTIVTSNGLDVATPIPQSEAAAEKVEPLVLDAQERRAFYVQCDGPWLRYDTEVKKFYFQSDEVLIYGSGTSKRKGWDGGTLTPRMYNGGVHYYKGAPVELPPLIPNMILSDEPTGPPTGRPTPAPTTSVAPTQTIEPTGSPTTQAPTEAPTTDQPTVAFRTLDMDLLEMSDKPVLMYAGAMYDVKARSDVELQAIGFNTFLTRELEMALYTREGGYKGAEEDLKEWEWRANVTVTGKGFGTPTYLPEMSFEPILLRKNEKMGIYLTTHEGPYVRLSKGNGEGRPLSFNDDLVVYEGVGKRYPIDSGTVEGRGFNGAFDYVPVDIPSPSPTIDTGDLYVREATFKPVQDTFIQRNNDQVMGKKAQLMVDGSPKRVALMKFNVGRLSELNGGEDVGPTQILKATLRLHSMTGSEYGGAVSIIRDGDIDEETTVWANTTYGEVETGEPIGEFRSVWPDKRYEMDVTEAFRSEEGIPKRFVFRISSTNNNGVMYRARDGASANGPRLFVTFAYDPDTNKEMAVAFGSPPPTQSPTVVPRWDNPKTPDNPRRSYFNYNPRSRYGPAEWRRTLGDGYYDKYRRLKTSTSRNRCGDGRRQSPRNLCETRDACLEYHETRLTRGEYGLGARNETLARPTPSILPNGLRLSYQERRSEWAKPIPPGADFARNGLNSGVQDLVNIDFKVRSEHRLCGKQYDGEMQLFYLHKYGNLEAISILIDADGDHNRHFQVMLDYFQEKFDRDERMCRRRQLRARAVFREGREGGEAAEGRSSKLRGSTKGEETAPASQVDEQDFADFDEEEATASTGSSLYQKIHDRFLSLVSRREQKELRWDPLKPMEMYRSVHFWSYAGSITHPPCFEDVKWRVVDATMKISLAQYFQLKRLMFDHVDPDNCKKTSVHYDESIARPVQPYRGGATYRCRRSDYASDMEIRASGRRKGFVLEHKWWGVDNHPYVKPEFPNV